MSAEVQWRNLAEAWFEKYADSLRAADWYVESFDELEEAEVEAIIEGLKHATHLYVEGALA